MGLAKRVIDGGLDGPLAQGLDLERDAFVDVFATEDARTGVQSFLENGPGKAIRGALTRFTRGRARVRSTVARRSSPHGIANTIGTSTPLSAYACTAARTCSSSPMI